MGRKGRAESPGRPAPEQCRQRKEDNSNRMERDSAAAGGKNSSAWGSRGAEVLRKGKKALEGQQQHQRCWPRCPPMPGRPTGIATLTAFVLFLLDFACWLPHPMAAPNGAPPPPSEVPQTLATPPPSLTTQRGLPSHKVRQNYHARLEAWEKRATEYKGNLTRAGQELPNADPELGPRWQGGGPICSLAVASVREREAARIGARLQGSAAIHCLLILRDLFMYKALSPFEPEAMLAKRHHKLTSERRRSNTTNSTLELSLDEVCEAVVAASMRTSAGFDTLAKQLEERQTSYLQELLWNYVLLAVSLALLAYMAELACCHKDK